MLLCLKGAPGEQRLLPPFPFAGAALEKWADLICPSGRGRAEAFCLLSVCFPWARSAQRVRAHLGGVSPGVSLVSN